MHGIGNLAPIAVIAFFAIATLWKRFSNATVRAEAEQAAAQAPVVPVPRRRLSAQSAPAAVPLPAAVPSPAPVPPAPQRIVADAFPAEAAAAFPGLDLSLPGAGGPAVFAAPRRGRPAGGAVLGSRGWAPGAIVAMEVLGPPVSIRPGATLGAPHAL